MKRYYILKEGKVVPCDLTTWAKWFERKDNNGRIVEQTHLVGKVMVSTVFLGLDHSFYDDESPVLWETMVFGGVLDQEQERCSGNKEQAEAMHRAMVNKVLKAELHEAMQPEG